MIALLCQANDLANEVHAQGLAALPAGDVGTRYDMPKPPTRPVPAVQAPAGESNSPPPTTSSRAYARTAMRSCVSSLTCAFPSITIRPNATSACPS